MRLVVGSCFLVALRRMYGERRVGGLCVSLTSDEEGRTPLHWAADMGHADAVQVLVAAGAPINEQVRRPMSSLQCALYL